MVVVVDTLEMEEGTKADTSTETAKRVAKIDTNFMVGYRDGQKI